MNLTAFEQAGLHLSVHALEQTCQIFYVHIRSGTPIVVLQARYAPRISLIESICPSKMREGASEHQHGVVH